MSAINPIQNQQTANETTFCGSCLQFVYDIVNKVKEVVMAILQTILPSFFPSASSIDPNAVTQLNTGNASGPLQNAAQTVQQAAASTGVVTQPPATPSGGSPAPAQPLAYQGGQQEVSHPPAPQHLGDGQPPADEHVDHAQPLSFLGGGAAAEEVHNANDAEVNDAAAGGVNGAEEQPELNDAAAGGVNVAAATGGPLLGDDEWLHTNRYVLPEEQPLLRLNLNGGDGNQTFADLTAGAAAPPPAAANAALPPFAWQPPSSSPAAAFGAAAALLAAPGDDADRPLPVWSFPGGAGLPPMNSLNGAWNGFAISSTLPQQFSLTGRSFPSTLDQYGASSSSSASSASALDPLDDSAHAAAISADGSRPPLATSPFFLVQPSGSDESVPGLVVDGSLSLEDHDSSYNRLMSVATAKAASTTLPVSNGSASALPPAFPARRDSVLGGSLPHDATGDDSSDTPALLPAAAASASSIFDAVFGPAPSSSGAASAAATSSTSAASPFSAFPDPNPSNADDTPVVTSAALHRVKDIIATLDAIRQGRATAQDLKPSKLKTGNDRNLSDYKQPVAQDKRTVFIESGTTSAKAGFFAACAVAISWKRRDTLMTGGSEMDELLKQAVNHLEENSEKDPCEVVKADKIVLDSLGNARSLQLWTVKLLKKVEERASANGGPMKPFIVVLTNGDYSISQALQITQDKKGLVYDLFSPNSCPLSSGEDPIYRTFTNIGDLRKSLPKGYTRYRAFELMGYDAGTATSGEFAAANAAAAAAGGVHVEAAQD